MLKPGGHAYMSFSNRCFPTKGAPHYGSIAHARRKLDGGSSSTGAVGRRSARMQLPCAHAHAPPPHLTLHRRRRPPGRQPCAHHAAPHPALHPAQPSRCGLPRATRTTSGSSAPTFISRCRAALAIRPPRTSRRAAASLAKATRCTLCTRRSRAECRECRGKGALQAAPTRRIGAASVFLQGCWVVARS